FPSWLRKAKRVCKLHRFAQSNLYADLKNPVHVTGFFMGDTKVLCYQPQLTRVITRLSSVLRFRRSERYSRVIMSLGLRIRAFCAPARVRACSSNCGEAFWPMANCAACDSQRV